MSHPARLLLRAPPHLPFIQGYPGIPASPNRKAAGVHGSLEMRIGSIPVKAKWVRVEIRKYESLPPGFPNTGGSSSEPVWEHVGEINTLWKPSDESKETEQIETADFKFFLPLPENIPPSVELPRSTGIRYELVAALCYKQKSGLFKKESYPILKISEPLIIIKHDLHSSWPLYNIPDSKTIKTSNDQLILNVSRPNTAFSSGDSIQFSASLKSSKSQPFKLKGFECTIYELITSIPIPPDSQGTKGKKRKSLQNPITKSRPISTVKAAVDERIGLGGEKSAKIEMLVDRVLVTVKNARTLRVEYALEVKAVMEGIRDKIEINGIMYTVGVFDRNTAEQATGDIGRVDLLCPEIPQPSPPPRPIDSTPFAGPQPDLPPNARFNGNSLSPGPGYFPPQRPTSGSYNQQQQQQPQQPIQGFDSRQPYQRHASSNSASTFTTTNTQTNEFGMTPTPTQNRSYATMPTSPGQRRPDVMFPTAHPRPRSITPTSPTHDSASGHERYVQSDAGHDTSSNRYSTATMATFGRWDKGLKNAMRPEQESDRAATSLASSDNAITPTTPTVPSPSTRQSSPMPVVVSRPTSARPPVPPSSFYLSSEQEKTLQRERYEAARNAAGLPTSSQTTKKDEEEIPEIPPPEYAPPVPAQPKRQYAAPSRPVSEYTSLNGSSVNSSPKTTSSPRLTSPSPATRPSSGSNRMGSPPPPSIAEQTGLLSAAEEKEIQRKRYEEATSRVAETNTPPPKAGPSKVDVVKANSSSPNRQSSIIQALKTSPPLFPRKSSQGSTSDGPMPYNAIYPPDRTSSKADGSTPVGLGISANGMNEKEQMKRYYEAQEAVAQNQSNPNSPSRMINVGNSSVLSRKSGGGSVGSIGANEHGQRGGPGGPVDEKEQMRRYYEAQDRVASASGSGQSPAKPSEVTNLHNQNRDVSRPSSPSGSNPPTSASDEKEQMRRYYEAQDRVAAAARGENTAGPSTGTSQKAKQDTLSSSSAIDEKEQMRRYYEAQEKVAARTGSPPPGGPSGYTRQTTQTHSPTKSKTYAAVPAPVDEKEQMRRYYEAQDRVAAASRGESSGANMQQSPPRSTHQGSHAASPTRPETSAAASSAIDEKEQMRRYYEAQDRVARASQSPGIGSSSNNRISDTPTASPTKPRAISTAPTALNEKEQMRRYYEAQDRVARASSGSPQPGSSRPAVGTESMIPSSSSGGVSAIDEKEQMKRYYEAMDRVNRASDPNGSPSRARQSNASPPPPPVLAPPVESPPTFDEAPPSFAESSSNNAGTASASGSGSGTGYPSAEQEKEMMKKRYEQATSAVQRYNSPSPPPPEASSLSTAATNPFRRSLTNQPRTSLGLASEQIISNTNSAGPIHVPKGDDRGYFGSNDSSSPATSPPSSPFLARDPRIKAGKARAIDGSTTSNAPPPPLPARPPKEYVELLSPV